MSLSGIKGFAKAKQVRGDSMNDDADDLLNSDLMIDGDATDDFPTRRATALNALVALGRPSTSSDRRELFWQRMNLPLNISAFLGRARAIVLPPGESEDHRSKRRAVSEKGNRMGSGRDAHFWMRRSRLDTPRRSTRRSDNSRVRKAFPSTSSGITC